MDDDTWDDIYNMFTQPLQEGEKTIKMMMEERGIKTSRRAMQDRVDRFVIDGKLIFVGKRLVGSRLSNAYKLVV